MDQPEAPEHPVGLAASPNQADPDASLYAGPEPIEVTPANSSPSPLPNDTAIQPFGSALAPVLRDICKGRLTDLHWFRTDWQRGGALTGYATWTDDHGQAHPAVVKLPVPPSERRWLVQLSPHDVTPHVFAHGSALGGYDLAWVIMERLPYGPVGRKWGEARFELLADAAARFYSQARRVPLGDPPTPRDWEGQLKRARAHISRDTIANSQRWRKALKKAGKKLPAMLKTWRSRDTGTWCHGDLHLGNAMTRTAPPDGPALLFDLACVHAGHWVEDAVYLEHLYWANPATIEKAKPVKLIAKRMRDYQLKPGDHWPELANIYRTLLAMVAPAHLDAEGGSAHAAAALQMLESLV